MADVKQGAKQVEEKAKEVVETAKEKVKQALPGGDKSKQQTAAEPPPASTQFTPAPAPRAAQAEKVVPLGAEPLIPPAAAPAAATTAAPVAQPSAVAPPGTAVLQGGAQETRYSATEALLGVQAPSVEKADESLRGKVVVISGATSGLGLAAARAFVAKGATVIFAVRNLKKAAGVIDSIKNRYPSADIVADTAVDFQSLKSVRSYAQYLNSMSRPIHIFINNAGAIYMDRDYTDEDVGILVQVNYEGAYALTRLVERKLLENRARIVNVASATHRYCYLVPVRFLFEWLQGQYAHTKLADVMFSYELQRRLGPAGLQVAAVDPGGVRTAIWQSTIFSRFPFKQVIDFLYAPPEDGAANILHAATVPWHAERTKPLPPEQDLRYYAKGVFAWPLFTWVDASGQGIIGKLTYIPAMVNAITLSLIDYPLRRLSFGYLANRIAPVRSSKQTYDVATRVKLWDKSAEVAELPAQVKI